MKRLLLILLILVWSVPGWTRTASFSAQNFKSSADTGNYFQLMGSGAVPKGAFSLGLAFDYAHEPVILERPAGTKFQNLVARELSAYLTGAIGLTDWLDVGILVQGAPYLVFQPADTATEQTRVRMGDIRLNARLELLDPKEKPLGLAFVPMITVPTGNGNSFVGNNQFAGGGYLVAETPRYGDRFSISLNAGYELRERAVLTRTAAGAPQTVMNDLVLYGLGGNLAILPSLDLVGEVDGFTLAGDLFGDIRPMDYKAGFRLYVTPRWALSVGGGGSLISGIGNPLFRGFAGLAYVPEHKGFVRASKDTDGDGIPNKRDRCPDEAGPEALQGCPDTDEDGIPNIDDRCPTEAGPASNGGCPEKPQLVITPEEYRILTRPIHFDFEKATLRPDALPVLKELADALKVKPEIRRLSIEGHTDRIGTETFNQWLSEKRGLMVKDYLIRQGIESERLKTIGYGESKLLDPAHTVSANKKNRRVEFVFVEVDGMAIPEPVPQADPATLEEDGRYQQSPPSEEPAAKPAEEEPADKPAEEPASEPAEEQPTGESSEEPADSEEPEGTQESS